jgi:hypothetical protein
MKGISPICVPIFPISILTSFNEIKRFWKLIRQDREGQRRTKLVPLAE